LRTSIFGCFGVFCGFLLLFAFLPSAALLEGSFLYHPQEVADFFWHEFLQIRKTPLLWPILPAPTRGIFFHQPSPFSLWKYLALFPPLSFPQSMCMPILGFRCMWLLIFGAYGWPTSFFFHFSVLLISLAFLTMFVAFICFPLFFFFQRAPFPLFF